MSDIPGFWLFSRASRLHSRGVPEKKPGQKERPIMKTLMRTLTLSAAALAALVAAPQSDAQQFRRGEARESRPFRGESFRGRGHSGGEFRGPQSRGREFRGREFRGHAPRGGEFRGREFHGNRWHNRRFVRPPAYSYGRRYVSPFRVYAGSHFYSYCPGPGYVYIDDLGWVFPPFPGARWFPAHVDRFGVEIDGCWR
jgi:hypothetical protein